ncbi:hypothetical protein GQ602_001335 [Ophiocordyceps camponoti-floridani]|uniref:Uncharacterized protein n=1 Tax=Ophiocordyceps camponoti-floridani TaxID=2030778 RepID=A0A8H4VH05_9HYPO|nr:hypothetical protein GQ602_001335 [Ophiocordyceps camponoti-floridani]
MVQDDTPHVSNAESPSRISIYETTRDGAESAVLAPKRLIVKATPLSGPACCRFREVETPERFKAAFRRVPNGLSTWRPAWDPIYDLNTGQSTT